MQIYTIVIGGLEKSYMQKLVLYLNERLGKSARVELLEHWEIPEQPEVWEMKKQSVGGPMEGSKCWDTGIGSEAFITYLTEQHLVNHTLTVTAQKCTEKGTEKAVVYQYQPRDCLYREIVSKCPMNVGGRQKVEQEGGRQRWMVFTGEGQSGVLMAFSLFYAWMLSETKKVLYVNFTECSGMTELFELVEQPEDFSDFLLALRRQSAASLACYTGRIDELEYLIPADNPQILRELTEADMNRLLVSIAQADQYELVVFTLGTLVCGCEQIFLQAESRIHLCGMHLMEQCAGREKKRFISRCAPGREDVMKRIVLPEMKCEHTGVTLLYEWRETEPGRLAAELISAGD